MTIPNLRERPPGGPENTANPDAALGDQFLDEIRSIVPFGAKPNIGEVMSDMRALKALRESLDPLSEAGFQISDVTVINKYEQVEHRVTVLLRHTERHFILQLPPPILVDPADRLLFSSLWLLFPPGSSVFVFLAGVDALPIELENILGASPGLSVRFVPWIHVAGRLRSHSRKVHLLLSALGLLPGETDPAEIAVTPPDLETRTPESGRWRPVADAKRTPLVSDLAGATLPIADRDGFFEVINRLPLGQWPRRVAGCLWTGDRHASTFKLVRWAEAQGGDVLEQLRDALADTASYAGTADSPRDRESARSAGSAAGPGGPVSC